MGDWYKPWNWADDSRSQIDQRKQLTDQGDAASSFATTAGGNYQTLGAQGGVALGALQRQASGQDSVSAEQLRQGLGQLYAQQASMAAGASPRDAVAAARTATIQSGRIGGAMAGQQSIAGLQERAQAQQAYASMLQGLRQQDLQATLGSRQTAVSAYGGYKPEGSFLDKWGNAVAGGIAAATKLSDRRLKTDISDGDEAANKAISKLGAHLYRYKGSSAPRELGAMAQELEGAGLKHAVIETPRGKAVHGASAATAGLAMIGALGRRLAKLEGGK